MNLQRVIDSPFSEGKAVLQEEMREADLRGEHFRYLHRNYRCEETGLEFTTDDMDFDNLEQIYAQYRELHGIPSPADSGELFSPRILGRVAFFFLCTLFIAPLFLLTSCQRAVKVSSVQTTAIPVDASSDSVQDLAYTAYLEPTKEALEREMNVQIGYAPERLWVRGPECPMLNWATDALWEAAKKVYPGRVDIAIVNMGGMRCDWPAGPITKGQVFELMPFDNELVVLTLKGEDILALCESFAQYGGQGVAGMRVKTVDGRLADVQVAGRAVNPNALYTVATSDYLSGGTDHMDALTRYVDYWKSDLLIRDLYLEAVQTQDTIRSAVDGRMEML